MNIFKKSNLNTSNQFYKLVFIIIVVIYVFFFSSKYIIFNTSNLEYTDLNTQFELSNGQVVKVVSMDYSKEQKIIQAEIEVDYDEISTDTEIEFYAVEKNKMGFSQHNLKTEVVLNKDKLKVVNILNVNKRFSQIALIMIPDGLNLSEAKNSDIQTIQYTNYKEINKVSRVENLSYDGYLIKQLKRNIDNKNEEIKDKKNKIVKMNNQIKQLEDIISEFEVQLAVEVGDDADKTKEDINNYKLQIEYHRESIRTYEMEIEIINDEINHLNNNIDKLSK